MSKTENDDTKADEKDVANKKPITSKLLDAQKVKATKHVPLDEKAAAKLADEKTDAKTVSKSTNVSKQANSETSSKSEVKGKHGRAGSMNSIAVEKAAEALGPAGKPRVSKKSAAKPSEAKPPVIEPANTNPPIIKPSDAKQTDTKQSETKQKGVKPPTNEPSDTKTSDTKPSSVKKSAAKPSAAMLAEVKNPVNPKATEPPKSTTTSETPKTTKTSDSTDATENPDPPKRSRKLPIIIGSIAALVALIGTIFIVISNNVTNVDIFTTEADSVFKVQNGLIDSEGNPLNSFEATIVPNSHPLSCSMRFTDQETPAFEGIKVTKYGGSFRTTFSLNKDIVLPGDTYYVTMIAKCGGKESAPKQFLVDILSPASIVDADAVGTNILPEDNASTEEETDDESSISEDENTELTEDDTQGNLGETSLEESPTPDDENEFDYLDNELANVNDEEADETSEEDTEEDLDPIADEVQDMFGTYFYDFGSESISSEEEGEEGYEQTTKTFKVQMLDGVLPGQTIQSITFDTFVGIETSDEDQTSDTPQTTDFDAFDFADLTQNRPANGADFSITLKSDLPPGSYARTIKATVTTDKGITFEVKLVVAFELTE